MRVNDSRINNADSRIAHIKWRHIGDTGRGGGLVVNTITTNLMNTDLMSTVERKTMNTVQFSPNSSLLIED